MEKRIAALEDLEEIKRLQREYVFLVNDHQLDRLVDFFVENGTAEIRNLGVREGRDEIAALYAGIAQRMPVDTGHLLAQPVITVDGGTAEGHWQMYSFFPDKTIQWVQTRFDVGYIKVGGKWKIKTLRYRRPWPETIHDYLAGT